MHGFEGKDKRKIIAQHVTRKGKVNEIRMKSFFILYISYSFIHYNVIDKGGLEILDTTEALIKLPWYAIL